METFEETYQDVLHNIETALIHTYRAHDDMTDWEAFTAVNNLIRVYTAAERQRNPPRLKMDPFSQQAFDQVQRMCEWRLGRAAPFADEAGQTVDIDIAPKTVSEIIACLKRIRKSIKMWQKKGGRRGYFDFASQFIP